MVKRAKAQGPTPDIDEIFSQLTPQKATEPVKKKKKSKRKAQTAPVKEEKKRSFDEDMGLKQKVRKVTEEGYKIYTAEELKIGQGKGDTKDCPFDCQCCY